MLEDLSMVAAFGATLESIAAWVRPVHRRAGTCPTTRGWSAVTTYGDLAGWPAQDHY
jgi:hypothetical protein